LPVYKGADLIAKSLDCLQQQTFPHFEAIISVDGNDAETAAACRPFLADRRFRMIVQSGRLDWVGNFNWLLQQEPTEFFCYRQHDDTTAPEFFETLLQSADRAPNAAAIYCDCKYSGKSNHLEIAHSIEGEPLARMFEFIERIPNVQGPPIRGLIRSAAIRQAGLVRIDEFRAPLQIHGWLAKLLCWGSFKRVAKPLYYRLDRARSFTREYMTGAEDRKRAAWATMFTGLLDAAMPLCRTQKERLFFQRIILARIVAYPSFHSNANPNSRQMLIAECVERLRYERNSHLLDEQELSSILPELEVRLDEVESTERSKIWKGVDQIRQRARLGRLIYPSRMRRLTFQIHHLVEMSRHLLEVLSRRMSRLFHTVTE
jgi:glycosyltransferase involved in cell wall biosynthesis